MIAVDYIDKNGDVRYEVSDSLPPVKEKTRFIDDMITLGENTVIVLGSNEDVFTTILYCNRINFMAIDDLREPVEVKAKIRYNHKGDSCIIKKVDDDLVEVEFNEPQRAVTPGQAVVFYKDDYIVGGGTII